MSAKMKSCFTGHAMMHSLFGLGLGILLSALFSSLAIWWLGLALMIISILLDAMRKE